MRSGSDDGAVLGNNNDDAVAPDSGLRQRHGYAKRYLPLQACRLEQEPILHK